MANSILHVSGWRDSTYPNTVEVGWAFFQEHTLIECASADHHKHPKAGEASPELLLLSGRPGSGPRREGRPPRAHRYISGEAQQAAGTRSLGSAVDTGKNWHRTSVVSSPRCRLRTCPFLLSPPPARPPARLLVRGVFRLVSRDHLLLVCPCTSASSPLPQQHFAISNNQQQIGE
jgi:hypothetical protein